MYNAVRANEDLWSKCLLVVLYDEHGVFMTTKTPPSAVPPDHHQEEYTFDQLGLLVPAILVLPSVQKGVLNINFDRTSLLQYLTYKWNLGPLGARTAAAKTFAGAIGTKVRTDCPKELPLGGPAGSAVPAPGRPVMSSHQTALFSMTQLLESMTDVEANSLKGRISRMIVGFDGAVDVGMERVEDFLSQSRS